MVVRVCISYNPQDPEKSVYRNIPYDEWDGYDDEKAYYADMEEARRYAATENTIQQEER